MEAFLGVYLWLEDCKREQIEPIFYLLRILRFNNTHLLHTHYIFLFCSDKSLTSEDEGENPGSEEESSEEEENEDEETESAVCYNRHKLALHFPFSRNKTSSLAFIAPGSARGKLGSIGMKNIVLRKRNVICRSLIREQNKIFY